MAPTYMTMEEGPLNALMEETVKALSSRGYKPRVVPRGSVRELRGGFTCIDLEDGGSIDSAVFMARGTVERLEQRSLYRIDYAVRGYIQGVPARRRVTNVRLTWEGLLRKRLKTLGWVVPRERESQPHYALGTEGAPPSLGEVWSGGPHQVLTGLLNGDAELIEGVRGFVERIGERGTALNVYSDRWGESLRVSGGVWVSAEDLLTVYASPQYLKMVDCVCGHLRETRRRFGGITF